MRIKPPFKPSRIPGLALHLDACQGITTVAIPAWVTSTVYAVGTRVVQSATYYKCATAHTSGTFADDLAAVKWVATTDGAVSVVSSWADQSTNGRNAAQVTNALRPALIPSGLNSKPVLRFDGSNDTLLLTATNLLRNVAGATGFIVCNTTGGNSYRIGLAIRTANDLWRVGFATYCVGTGYEWGGRRTDADGYQGKYAGTIDTSYHIHSALFTFSAATLATFKDGAVLVASAAFQTAGNTSDTSPYNDNWIGSSAGGGGGTSWFGGIAEIIIFSSALTTAQINQVNLYLSRKWNIAVSIIV